MSRKSEKHQQQQMSADHELSSASFVTVTNVMNALNQSLHDLSPLDDATTTTGKSSSPHFELQRRLPDGSTRRATLAEQKAADCQSKLDQAAAFVQDLTKWSDRAAYANTQRLAGNQLYQKQEYEQAMDVYLTCLPALAAVPPSAFAGNNHTMDNESEQQQELERRVLFAKVLNNLAQTTLQLHWYQKTEQFCSMALQHLQLQDDKDNQNMETRTMSSLWTTATTPFQQQANTDFCQQVSNLYFRRARARRLRGEYTTARLDLQQAHDWLRQQQAAALAISRTTAVPTFESAQERDLNKELALLQQAVAEGRRNRERQKVALQRAMMTPTTTDEYISEHSHVSHFGTVRHRHVSQKGATAPPTSRNYSTLRAPSRRQRQQVDHPHPPRSPWQRYRQVMGRVAEQMLEWTGGDGDDDYSETDGFRRIILGRHAKMD